MGLVADKILIIDDMSSMRMLIKLELKKISGMALDEAGDGQAAWEKLSAGPAEYRLVLTDMNMPKLNGIDLIKKIRGQESLLNLPVIVLTSEAEDSMRDTALQAGASGYLVKPIDREALKSTIQKLAPSVLSTP
jgi:two-component system chemotaxis response regulator CheY